MRPPSTLWAIGFTLPVALTIGVVLLRLEYVPTLIVTASGYFAAGVYTARQRWTGPGPVVLPLVIPAAAVYSLFALNAESWQLLGVPGLALVGCFLGLVVGGRTRPA
jgi:hypothetical protein